MFKCHQKTSSPQATDLEEMLSNQTVSGITKNEWKTLDEMKLHVSHIDGNPSNIPICDDCEKNDGSLSYCSQCQAKYCEQCWQVPVTHRRAPRIGQLVHEKTSLALAKKIQNCIQPSRTAETLEMLHKKDQSTTWFGAARDVTGDESSVKFYNNRRFEELIFRYPPRRRSRLYPGSVSFLGQTGMFP